MGRKYIDSEKIVQMYQSGRTLKETAKELGYCEKTVRRTLSQNHIELRRENREQKQLDRGKILALHRAGWKAKDIAGDMGISEDTVKEVLKRRTGA